ncbi:Yip1 family protein [Bacillus toyonensis]|uniref:Yip1 family protein n=1 Tax=Bacillus toyonensis TaxID=155322 RepID=UPI001F0A59A5|nr:Yip1 family protein [Bacillus toyonensis]
MDNSLVVNKEKNNYEKPSLIFMITSPISEFERMKIISPIWFPLIFLSVIQAIIGILSVYARHNNPELVKIKQEVFVGMELPLVSQMMLGGFASIFIALITPFIWGIILKIVMMLMSKDVSYKKLVSITVFSSVISILGKLINTLLTLFIGGEIVTYTSLGSIFEPGTLLYIICSKFEVFSIWELIIIGMGLNIVAGLSKKQMNIFIAVFFFIPIIFSIIKY